MTLNIDAKYEVKLTCVFKKNDKEFSKFSPEHA